MAQSKQADYGATLKECTTRWRVDPKLMSAIITVESAWNPWAVRYEPNYGYPVVPDGYARTNNISKETERQCQHFSWGLCQVMGGTARYLGYNGALTQLLDPFTNLMYGCKYLSSKLKEYPTTRDLISAYNAGTPVMMPTGKYANQDYVDRVLAALGQTG